MELYPTGSSDTAFVSEPGVGPFPFVEFVPEVIRTRFPELLKTDHKPETSLESWVMSFQDAAVAGAQLIMTATFISTALMYHALVGPRCETPYFY